MQKDISNYFISEQICNLIKISAERDHILLTNVPKHLNSLIPCCFFFITPHIKLHGLRHMHVSDWSPFSLFQVQVNGF